MALFIVIVIALASVGPADFAEEKRQEAIICAHAAAPAWCDEATR